MYLSRSSEEVRHIYLNDEEYAKLHWEDEIDIYNRKPTFFNYHESDIYLKAEFDNFESIVEDIVIPAKSGYTLEHSIPLGTTGVNYYAKLLDGEGYVLIGRFNTKRNKI